MALWNKMADHRGIRETVLPSVSCRRRVWACLATGTAIAAASYSPAFPLDFGVAEGRTYQFQRETSTSKDPTNNPHHDWVSIGAGQSQEIVNVDGPGVITYIWFTVTPEQKRNQLMLRAFWDNETTPSVEAPLGLFFGAAFDDEFPPTFTNAFFDVSPKLGLNCHLPMPFGRHARIVVQNVSNDDIPLVYFNVDYVKPSGLPSDIGYLHATYHDEDPCAMGQPCVFATANGHGHILGVNLAIESRADGWWGEGDDIIEIDGHPITQGTGTEDYFGGSTNFEAPDGGLATHAGLYQGSPRLEPGTAGPLTAGARNFLYRFHGPDPIPFRESFTYEMQHGEWNERTDHWASVAFWYKTRPSWGALLGKVFNLLKQQPEQGSPAQ